MTVLAHIADRVLNRPLMILPDKLALIASVLEGRIGIDAAGLKEKSEAEVTIAPEASRYVGDFAPEDASKPNGKRKSYRTTSEGVAIIPVLGSLVNRGSWLDAMSGVTSYERLKFQISAAARDDDVKSILLDMDSPGGEAIGAFEVADAVRIAAESKEIVAVVNGMAASAAYAIASAATKIVTTKSGMSGSIGVVMLHADYSHRLHEAGIVPTLIHAGKRKVDGSPYKPLTDEVKGVLKAEIEKFNTLFVETVAEGRKSLTAEAILSMEASVYIGADAVAIGLADAVGSFETVLSDLTGRPAPSKVQPSKGLRSMTKETSSEDTVTRGQLDAAVTLAVSEANAAHKPALDAAVAEATTAATAAGSAAANDRFKAIHSLEETKGREAQAFTLAATTSLSTEEVKGILAAAPVGSPNANRAGNSGIGLVVEPGKNEASSSSWDKALSKAGAQIG